MVDITGVKVWADFEVIQIVEDVDPYPMLLGLDWAIDMGGIINLKKMSMVFETEATRVIVPLDPTEGERTNTGSILRPMVCFAGKEISNSSLT